MGLRLSLEPAPSKQQPGIKNEEPPLKRQFAHRHTKACKHGEEGPEEDK
jgi:hypothetical protein